MTRKPRIKPPPVPAGEDPLITIGNQEKQIDMLLKRIETLTAQVDTYARDCRKAEEAFEAAEFRIKTLESNTLNMRATHTRLAGWQDCAREMFDKLVRE